MSSIKKWAKTLGKWGLILFIAWEISQVIIGAYFGLQVAWNITEPMRIESASE